MSLSAKKEEERRAFELARQQVLEWQGETVDDLGENPDIVLPELGIGVEVTAIVDGRRRAEWRAKLNALGFAQARHQQETGPTGLHVSAAFARGLEITKTDQEPACQELLSIVRSNFSPDTKERFSKRLGGYRFGARYFSAVSLHFHPEVPSSGWQLAEANAVLRHAADEIQSVIASKEARLTGYRARAPRCWLLVVTNGFDPSTATSIDDDALTATYESSFDGVVLLDDAMWTAHRLRLVRPVTSGAALSKSEAHRCEQPNSDAENSTGGP